MTDERDDWAAEAVRIVEHIGNIGNRADIRETQQKQVAEILALVRAAFARGERRGVERSAEVADKYAGEDTGRVTPYGLCNVCGGGPGVAKQIRALKPGE
jgi:hypothetical protein